MKRHQILFNKQMEEQLNSFKKYFGDNRMSLIISKSFDALEKDIGLHCQLKDLTSAIIEKNKEK